MELPQFSDSEFEQRNTTAIELFVDSVTLIDGDNLDNELVAIEHEEVEPPVEKELSLDGELLTHASAVLAEYGFEQPTGISFYWQIAAEETYEKDGLMQTDPSEEVVSIALSYSGAVVEFFVTITDGEAEVLLEKGISIEDQHLGLSDASEKYMGVFSLDEALNRSLIETIFKSVVDDNDARETFNVTETELEGLIAMTQAVKEK